MINTDVSMLRIIENIFGNIVIFIPFGLLFPILLKKKEKNIKNYKEEKILVEMTIIPTSKVYVCYNTIDYFFSTISKEHISYAQLFNSDFIEASDEMFSKENNVLVWSMDGKNINNIVIIEWIE